MCNYGSIPDIKLLIGSPALMILLMEPMREPMQFYFAIPDRIDIVTVFMFCLELTLYPWVLRLFSAWLSLTILLVF